jgi:putative thioredoxin
MQPGRSTGPASPPPPPALAGAVDLSGLKARATAPAPSGPGQAVAPDGSDEAAAAGGRPYVIDVTEATFSDEVLERSFQVPVVLDLWAEWCGPCKQLSPVLEKLAREGGGSWVLAKIDVDANPALAQALRVQGIPAVKAVFQGQLIGEFTGAVPEPQARQFITALLEATGGAEAAATANGATAEEPEDPRVVAAEDAVARGDLADAARRYQEILAADPAHPRAADALREVELLRRVAEAPSDAVTRADAAPDDVDAQLAAADAELAAGQVDAAFGRLLATVRRTGGPDRDQVRDRLFEMFAVVGPDDPRVAPARRDLASALF